MKTSKITQFASQTLRAAVLASIFLGPVGVLAANNVSDGASGPKGAGLVLYVSLARR